MQISDTAAIKTGLACSKTGMPDSVNTAKPPFAAGDIVVLKATYGKEGQVSGSSTLSDGSVEQYPARVPASTSKDRSDCIHSKASS